MTSFLCLTILVITMGFVYGEDCPKKCEENAAAILQQEYVCGKTSAEVQQSLKECFSCNNTSDLLSRFRPIAAKLDQREIENNCNGGRLTTCNTPDILQCALESIALIPVIAQFQVDNVAKLCTDIARLTTTLNRCARCITAAIPGSSAFGDEVMRYVNITTTLINGGCNCANSIVSQVQALTKPGAKDDCDIVSASLNIIKAVATDCSLKLASIPINLPFVDIVDNYVNTIVPSSILLCNAIVGPDPAGVAAPSPSPTPAPTLAPTPFPNGLIIDQTEGQKLEPLSSDSAAVTVFSGMTLLTSSVALAFVSSYCLGRTQGMFS